MRGDLVEKIAADVCRELAAQGASGILAIDGPGGPGRVVFVDGRIIAAVSPTPRARLGDRLVGAGELDPDDLANALAAQQDGDDNLPLGSLLVERGLVRRDAVRVFVQEQVLDALFEIIRWRYGAFAFEPDDVALGQGVPLSLSVDDALVEVARRQHEWNELSQVIPDLDSVPSFRTGGATASAALEPDEFAVLASVDGTRSVRALAADLGYGEFEAARIVYGLSLLGIVDVRPPQDEIGAALEDALGLADFEETVTHESAPVSGSDADTAAPPTEDVEAPPPDRPPADAEPADTEPADTEPADTEAADHAEPEDDAPEVWVASPQDPTEAAEPPSQREDEPTTGQVLDAEVELPTDIGEDPVPATDGGTRGPRRSGLGRGLAAIIPGPDDLPDPDPAERRTERVSPAPDAVDQTRDEASVAEPPSADDASRWDDLAAVAEQAASDPHRDQEPRTPSDHGSSSVAATTGPTPGNESPPSPEQPPSDQQPAAGSAPDRAAEGTRSEGPQEQGREPGSGPPSKPQRGDDNDVSEFLRELSRLSVDPPSDPSRPKPPSRPTPPPSPSSSDQDSKKKRRGLFGRG